KLTGIDQAQVSAAATEAAELAYLVVDEREREEVVPASNEFLELSSLPEVKAAKRLRSESNGRMPFAKFVEWAKSENVAVNEALKLGQARNWLERVNSPDGPFLVLNPNALHLRKGLRAVNDPLDTDIDDYALEIVKHEGKFFVDQIEDEGERNRARKLLS